MEAFPLDPKQWWERADFATKDLELTAETKSVQGTLLKARKKTGSNLRLGATNSKQRAL
jgi:hypothetical protein